MMMALLLLHPADNILVAAAAIPAGATLSIDGQPVAAQAAIDVGHKVARHALAPGDKVIKHGAPIGSITTATAPGAHVHLHNMKSDYIESHMRGTLDRRVGP